MFSYSKDLMAHISCCSHKLTALIWYSVTPALWTPFTNDGADADSCEVLHAVMYHARGTGNPPIFNIACHLGNRTLACLGSCGWKKTSRKRKLEKKKSDLQIIDSLTLSGNCEIFVKLVSFLLWKVFLYFWRIRFILFVCFLSFRSDRNKSTTIFNQGNLFENIVWNANNLSQFENVTLLIVYLFSR